MASIIKQLGDRVGKGLETAFGPDVAFDKRWLTPTSDPKFGDYQFNGAMALAKVLKSKPRDIATKIVEALDVAGIAGAPEIAGPGFINIKLTDEFLVSSAGSIVGDDRVGVEQAGDRQTVVVDFSCPNLAKEMHVGHLRSTIIGDAICRCLEFLGHDVSRINHVGDFGGLGLLIQYVRETQPEVAESPESFHVADLEEFYRQARQREKDDPGFAEAARQAIVDLQNDEPVARSLWRAFRAESLRHCQGIYDRLDVRLETVGESDYLAEIPGVLDELREKGLMVENQGAQCIFLEGFKNKEGDPLPMIVQKSGGGYLYATTDLAALRRRVREMHADRVIYVTDAGQRQHFEMVFGASRAAGLAKPETRLQHVGFGVMLGGKGGRLRTRDGGTIKLANLLTEAEARALDLIQHRGETYSTAAQNKRQSQTESQQTDIARAVGIGSVKYADLSQDHTSDYVFSWDKMLSFDGNTAPYMMYAYARIRSVFDRAGVDADEVVSGNPELRITHPGERALIVKLLQLPDLMDVITDNWRLHELPTYLFSLSNVFMGLYQDKANWPLLDAESPIRESRLALCAVTSRVLKLGLGLLGIDTVEQM